MFIGQGAIVQTILSLYAPAAKAGKKIKPFLFVAPSGYGKTDLALRVLAACGGNKDNSAWIASCENLEFLLKYLLDQKYKYILMDEIHTLGKGYEAIYPYMDGRKVLVFATNLTGKLPEAFVNRCKQFTFLPYSIAEMEEIITMVYKSETQKNIPDYAKTEIRKAGNGNPRITKQILSEYILAESIGQKFQSAKEVETFVEQTCGIVKGFSTIQRTIITVLERMPDCQASLETLSNILHIDKGTIQREEALLIAKSIVGISARGRFLIQKSNHMEEE